MTAVDAPAGRVRLLTDVRDLAGIVWQAETVADCRFLRVEVAALASVEKQAAGAVRTPVLRLLEAAVVHLSRAGRDVPVGTARRLAGECLARAVAVLEVSP